LQYGKDYCTHLDGEYTIVIFDFEKNIFLLSSDLFKTKPLYYAKEGTNFGIASYKSSLLKLGFAVINTLHGNITQVFNICTLEKLAEVPQFATT